MWFSKNHLGYGLRLDGSLTNAIRTDFWQVATARASQPLPLQGRAYFEVAVKRPGRMPGDALHGFYWVGVATEHVDVWDGQWWDDERALECWAIRNQTCTQVHSADKGARTHAEICGPVPHEDDWARRPWLPGSSWGNADAIGVLVDQDAGTIYFYRNQVFAPPPLRLPGPASAAILKRLPIASQLDEPLHALNPTLGREQQLLDHSPAFEGLAPKQELFAFVTLTHTDASAAIAFRPIPAEKPLDASARVVVGGPKAYNPVWSESHMAEVHADRHLPVLLSDICT
jgi:hypothetical protein